MRSRVVFDFWTWDITVRELIAAPTIIGVFVILGFIIAGKIDDKVQSANLMYNTAPHVENAMDFKDRLANDKRHIFASGNLVAENPIDFNSVYASLRCAPPLSDLPSGKYLYIEIMREHYTRHTRIRTDDNGKRHREVYYSWDCKETASKWASNVVFNEVIFPTSKFNFHISSRYINCETHFDDRWTFRAIKENWDGIIFTEVANNDISDETDFYIEYESIDELLNQLTSSHAILIFWIAWSILIVLALVGFFYIDNAWLD
jgi:uncharacterized protein YozE (UPF0346 family)